MMLGRSKLVHVIIGIILFIIGFALLPAHVFSLEGRLALATISVMIYWWITQPVHIAVTALLPIVVNSLFGIVPMSGVLAQYFSPTAVLLLGANIIVIAWIKTGLSKRIALRVLILIGTNVKKQILVWFIISTLLSMFLPNTVVAASLCPIAVAMFKSTSEDGSGPRERKTMFLILLAIVWGAGIGGFGTPLGGAMNLVAIGHIEAFTGAEYMYITWTLHMLPYLLILAAGTCIYLMFIRTDTKTLTGSRAYFNAEMKKIGPPNRGEFYALSLFCIAVLLAFTRPFYQDVLPDFKPYYAFLLLGMGAFFLNDEHKQRLLTWDYAVKNINWGLIILFAGGMAAGGLLVSTGAAEAIAGVLTAGKTGSMFVIIFIVIVLGMLLSNASSNTAATAILVPIVISIAAAKSVSPMPYVYIAAAACNCAFVLPTSIRAIPVGYGLEVGFMLKKGLAAVVVTLVLLTAAAYVRMGLL